MTAVPESDIVSDAELAVAAATGDQTAFAGIYDRYADRLYDFCVGMVRDRNAAADCVQDTFCTAATRLASLREPDKLRPWLYAIARNEALKCIRERRREQPSDELPDESSSEPSPDTLAARTELAELVAQAAGGLSDRDRAVLELTYRHGLDGPELADALGVSAATARTLTHRLRETVERSLGALLVMKGALAGHGCPELAASVKGWDGQFTVLTRKRVARHIDSCLTCEASRRKLVNREALLGAAPLFIPAPEGLRTRTLDRIQLVCAQSALGGAVAGAAAGPANASAGAPAGPSETDGADDATALAPVYPLEEIGVPEGGASDDAAGDDDKRRRRGLLLLLLLLLALALFAALWLALSWPFAKETPPAPVGVTETSSQPRPTPTTSAPPLPPPPPVATTTEASPPPPTTYRQQPSTRQYFPPAPAPEPEPENSAPPETPAPEIPKLRPTPGMTGPLFPVPRATGPNTSGGGHTGKGPSGGTTGGTTGGGTTGGGTTGGGTTGGGTTGGGTTGGGTTGGGTTGGGGTPGDTSGPVR